jgi:hypothetical protein
LMGRRICVRTDGIFPTWPDGCEHPARKGSRCLWLQHGP